MKKMLLLLAMATALLSCDFMLKDRKDREVEVKNDKKVVLGNDKDARGCVTSAGYRWSQLRNECIRAFEEGYRLNSVDQLEGESTAKSAFVIFEDNGGQAELFLPDGSPSILLKKQKDGIYQNSQWSLHSKKGYMLQQNGKVLFAAAAIQENQVIGDDNAES